MSVWAAWTSTERSALEPCLVIPPDRWFAALWYTEGTSPAYAVRDFAEAPDLAHPGVNRRRHQIADPRDRLEPFDRLDRARSVA